MSRKSLGEIVTCDICKKAQIDIPEDVRIRIDYSAIGGTQRGLVVSVSEYGYYGDVDICKECKIEAMRKAIKVYEGM